MLGDGARIVELEKDGVEAASVPVVSHTPAVVALARQVPKCYELYILQNNIHGSTSYLLEPEHGHKVGTLSPN